MKRIAIILSLIAPMLLGSCRSVDDYADDPHGNFEALWKALDEHYCFFAEKGVDWKAMQIEYGQRISSEMTDDELFSVCAEMLETLRDGHTNLIAPFNTSSYRQWWSDYPENFHARLIEDNYFNYNYRQTSGITYGILTQNIGYMRYPSFSATVGDGNLDEILYYLKTCDGLVIDIRNNGGGNLTNVETLVARFIDRQILAGYILHKTGPAHDAFSEPYPYYINPAPEGRMMWTKPIAVLTNRSTFSAANEFVSVMKSLPQVKIVGATTGGGSGLPFSSDLPNGWTVRFSASPMLDAEGRTTEFGIAPSEGCAVDLDEQAALSGRDTILDFAIALLLK